MYTYEIYFVVTLDNKNFKPFECMDKNNKLSHKLISIYLHSFDHL